MVVGEVYKRESCWVHRMPNVDSNSRNKSKFPIIRFDLPKSARQARQAPSARAANTQARVYQTLPAALAM